MANGSAAGQSVTGRERRGGGRGRAGRAAGSALGFFAMPGRCSHEKGTAEEQREGEEAATVERERERERRWRRGRLRQGKISSGDPAAEESAGDDSFMASPPER